MCIVGQNHRLYIKYSMLSHAVYGPGQPYTYAICCDVQYARVGGLSAAVPGLDVLSPGPPAADCALQQHATVHVLSGCMSRTLLSLRASGLPPLLPATPHTPVLLITHSLHTAGTDAGNIYMLLCVYDSRLGHYVYIMATLVQYYGTVHSAPVSQ